MDDECVFVKRRRCSWVMNVFSSNEEDVLGWMMNAYKGGWGGGVGGVMMFVVDCQQRSSSWMMNVFSSNEEDVLGW